MSERIEELKKRLAENKAKDEVIKIELTKEELEEICYHAATGACNKLANRLMPLLHRNYEEFRDVATGIADLKMFMKVLLND